MMKSLKIWVIGHVLTGSARGMHQSKPRISNLQRLASANCLGSGESLNRVMLWSSSESLKKPHFMLAFVLAVQQRHACNCHTTLAGIF